MANKTAHINPLPARHPKLDDDSKPESETGGSLPVAGEWPLRSTKKMNRVRRAPIIALWCTVSFCQLLSARAEDEEYRTARIELTHEIAKESARSDEVCGTMAGIGIDFPVLVQRALDGDDAAVRLLLWAGENAPLDGAASEGFSYTMVKVARKIPDDRLAAAAKELRDLSFENTRIFFQFEFSAVDEDEEAATREIRRLFPMFWRQVTERVEQDGAHQPATRRESKSE